MSTTKAREKVKRPNGQWESQNIRSYLGTFGTKFGVKATRGMTSMDTHKTAKIATMMTVGFALLAMVFTVVIAGLGAKKTSGAEVRTVTVKVDGMTCASCAASIHYKLSEMKGVVWDTVDLAKGLVQVRYSDQTTLKGILAGVENLGYRAKALD